jgi:hypothetical protein
VVKKMLGTIFLRKEEQVRGDWRNLHNEKPHNLYASPDIIRMIKSEWIMWAEREAVMREMKNVHKILA